MHLSGVNWGWDYLFFRSSADEDACLFHSMVLLVQKVPFIFISHMLLHTKIKNMYFYHAEGKFLLSSFTHVSFYSNKENMKPKRIQLLKL